MDAKKIAEETPEEERLSKSQEYLLESAENQKKAAQELNEQLNNVQSLFGSILENVPNKDYQKTYNTINKLNKLINDAKQGKDIDSIIKQLKSIK